ncbi:MAG: hypothetical protein AB7O96_14860 [Pseudobdellovibrionaceae bacterium]
MRLHKGILLCVLAAAVIGTGCRRNSYEHPRDVSTGVGHGGKEVRDGCKPQRFCDRNGCENRPVCDGVGDGNGGGAGFNIVSSEVDIQGERTLAWQEEFGISPESQKVLDRALAVAYSGSFEGLAQLGLNEKDIRKIAEFEAPTERGIVAVSRNLKMSPAKTKEMLKFMIGTVEAQASDVNSGLWKKCISSRHWLTPENNNCKKTYWNGCSPKTGASMCIPAR